MSKMKGYVDLHLINETIRILHRVYMLKEIQ